MFSTRFAFFAVIVKCHIQLHLEMSIDWDDWARETDSANDFSIFSFSFDFDCWIPMDSLIDDDVECFTFSRGRRRRKHLQ